jgi:O-methyltransferase
VDTFKKSMAAYNQKLPEINIGWFKAIDDDKYPEKICFAFFDGDFYTSILDSFEKVYHKMVPGGIILIHDYEWEHLPGVKVACDEFLKDKPEEIIYGGNCVAKMVKK